MENVVTHEDWKVCFSELAPGLVLFARQFVRTGADAEDIVQDAFVRFWRKEHSIENLGEASASLEMEQTTAPQFDFDDGAQQDLAAAVDRLPVEQREVLVMKIWNELTFAEIGQALGISQNTAASRYRYALAALKKNFVAHE